MQSDLCQYVSDANHAMLTIVVDSGGWLAGFTIDMAQKLCLTFLEQDLIPQACIVQPIFWHS